MKKRVALIGLVIDEPESIQKEVNAKISEYAHLVRGRMGIPFLQSGVSVISLTVVGSLDEINELTGKLGRIPGVTAGSSISKKELEESEVSV